MLIKILYGRPARLIREVKLTPHDTPQYDMSNRERAHIYQNLPKKGKLPLPEARFTTLLADVNRNPYKSEVAQR